ncbi:hypothetical protein SANTM175S_07439 [Streptomyces antimycoticus]
MPNTTNPVHPYVPDVTRPAAAESTHRSVSLHKQVEL